MGSKANTPTPINFTLASVAMLNSVFKATNRDLLDSLAPFVKAAIHKTARVGDEVKLDTITGYLNTVFGFESIPLSVTKTLLKRLSPVCLSKSNGKYFLKKSLESDVARFFTNERKYKQHCEQVGERLADYLNNYSGHANVNSSKALDCLLLFFEAHGFSLAKSPKSIAFLSSNKKRSYEYQVGQFILDEMEKKSTTFDFILEMLQGFFLSLAISLHAPSGSDGKAHFKQTYCYLDTRIILDALNCNTEEGRKASLELIKMLKEQGAGIRIFEHTLTEVDDILNAYEHSLLHPNRKSGAHTLESFDSRHASWKDVEIFRSTVRTKIDKLGIDVVDKEHYDKNNPPTVDESALLNYLNQNISYSRKLALKRDVDSIGSIAFLRKKLIPSSIESCGHIFITHNTRLAYYAEQYLHGNGNLHTVPYIIGEPDFTALLWLKCYRTHTEYPKIKLIQDALSSTAVTEDVMEAFYREVEVLEQNGGITEVEASAMKARMFNLRELMSLTYGDSEMVSSDTVLSIRNQLKEQYDSSAREAISIKERDLAKLTAKQNEGKERMYNEIQRIKKETSEKMERMLSFSAHAILIPICIIAVGLSIHSALSSNKISPLSITVALLSGLGTLDLFISRQSKIKTYCFRIAQTLGNKKADKKRAEYKKLFGDLDS